MSTEANASLGTDHLAGSLRRHSVRGGFAVLGVQSAQFVLNLASTAILARLLVPGDFGVVAMATAVTSLFALILDLGLGSATIQRGDLTPSQLSTLFWINTVAGVVLAGFVAGLAPLVARFYGESALVPVTAVLSLSFVFTGLSIQPTALLRRQMRFASLARIDLASLTLGLAAAIAGAEYGMGYWALVAFQLVQSASASAGSWFACGWRPGLPARSAGLRPLMSFGAGITTFSVLAYVSRTLDNVIIGRSAGSAALGLYLKAYSMLLLPVDRVRGPASAVVIPALSLLQNDPKRFRSYFLKAMTSVVAIGMPVVTFSFVFAREAVLLVLGPRWQGSVLLFQVLAPAAFVETFNTVGSWVCTPLGESRRLVRWQTFATIVMAVSFVVGVHWGALGVAIACSVSTVALRLPGIPYLLNDSPVSPVDLVQALAVPACASIGAGALLLVMRATIPLPLPGLVLMLVGAPAFVAIYLTGWLVLPGGRTTLVELLTAFGGAWQRAPQERAVQ